MDTVAGIIQRGSTWHFRWVVPDEYRPVADGRREIHKSLKTDSKSEAEVRARELERELRGRFEARLAGRADPVDGLAAFERAVRIAGAMGLSYKSAQELAGGSLEELLGRIDAARSASPDASNAAAVAAALGGAKEPVLMLSGLAAHVEAISADENRFKNATQMRKWRGGNRRAMAQTVEALGADKPVRDFTAEDAMKHLLWLEKKVAAKEIAADTVKKELTYAAGCFKRYYRHAGVVGAPRPYAGLSVSKGVAKLSHKPADERRKRELSEEWIRETLLRPGLLDGMNEEARDILLIAVESGCRQSEIYNTPLKDIVLDHKYPHFLLRPVEGVREIKNSASERAVPLVGVALSAMRRVVARGGFQRYAGKDNWSAVVNKYLRERQAMPTGCTIGGLRHAWEGRMRRAGIAHDERGVMMGHSVSLIRDREEYGDVTLAERYAFALRVAFDVQDPIKQ